MAKKKEVKTGGLPDAFDMIKKIDETCEIISESATSNIKDWISTGNYLLNASISGSLFGGVPAGRISVLSGVSGSAKSYLSCSICREAQYKDYSVLYLDSEGAIDKNFVSRLGCNPDKMIIKQVNTITETSNLIANLCKKELELEEEYGQHHKFIIVLDSLGNLTSEKERNDTIATADSKRDFTKTQEIKSLFRVNTTPLAKLGFPFIVVSHVYQTMDLFGGTELSGGSGIKYNASVTLELSPCKLDDKAANEAKDKAVGKDTIIKTGILVKARPKKSRFTIPRVVSFQIPFYKKPNEFLGLEAYLTWETAGVGRGNILTEKEYLKLSDAEKAKTSVFEFNGETKYFFPKDTARNIVVKHLGEAVPINEFFTERVFTEEFLRDIDERIIKPAFELPNGDSFQDIEEIEDSIDVGSEIEETEE